ncbi:COQ9 family protein [Roseovarius gahaiensis]|uniref:COQ9 family protein n=1 Tax=Roseovarius gahaiensis TaxID=2716691 RepID=A0A967B9P3_9RHOB|nr:COQ9 family protein [Roseovarius gahaiensis]NHQ73935.1 COQ9 family protein [Roseovarius gahaiensis]
MTDPDIKMQLLDAAKMHVPFDGWTEAAFQAAMADTGVDEGVARAVCPRGAIDLALAYHEEGDQLMLERLTATDLSDMRFRDRIAAAVRFRLEAVDDKELVRRGMTLFALPSHAPDGAKAVWGTCDQIWTALGDTSDDVNWYTKRATLSGVYSATLLYWLGDDTPDHHATWDFLDRRIDEVMQIEKFKAQVRDNKLLSGLMAGPLKILDGIKAPEHRGARSDMPGRWTGQF